MDPWIHGSAARAAAGAAAGAAASAAAERTYYVIMGRALRATLYVHDEIYTAAAKAAAPATAPAADPWIHIFVNHIFCFDVKSN